MTNQDTPEGEGSEDVAELDAERVRVTMQLIEEQEANKALHARVAELEGERDLTRAVLDWAARIVWDGGEIDGGSFQDKMVEAGLFVLVPDGLRPPEYIDEWGDTAEMYVLSWGKLGQAALARRTLGEGGGDGV